MMFSSRRSRNRHSANPNPKLHTPHLRRKISPHDGRTHQGPLLGLPNLASALGGPPPPPPSKDGGHGAAAAAMNAAMNAMNQASASAAAAAAAHPHMGAAAAAAAAGFPGMPAAAAAMLSPELLHRHQMELQRFHEMSKMSSLFGQHQHQQVSSTHWSAVFHAHFSPQKAARAHCLHVTVHECQLNLS